MKTLKYFLGRLMVRYAMLLRRHGGRVLMRAVPLIENNSDPYSRLGFMVQILNENPELHAQVVSEPLVTPASPNLRGLN